MNNGDLFFEVQVVMKLINLINKHYTEQHSPGYYTKALSINERALNKYCKMILNRTVYQLIQDKLHHEGMRMLLTTNSSVKQIAYEIGCCDPAYFNRCFKKKMGLSPRRYRLLMGRGKNIFNKV